MIEMTESRGWDTRFGSKSIITKEKRVILGITVFCPGERLHSLEMMMLRVIRIKRWDSIYLSISLSLCHTQHLICFFLSRFRRNESNDLLEMKNELIILCFSSRTDCFGRETILEGNASCLKSLVPELIDFFRYWISMTWFSTQASRWLRKRWYKAIDEENNGILLQIKLNWGYGESVHVSRFR
jgi:hypothetical protein